jgi:hypothetical protein
VILTTNPVIKHHPIEVRVFFIVFFPLEFKLTIVQGPGRFVGLSARGQVLHAHNHHFRKLIVSLISTNL